MRLRMGSRSSNILNSQNSSKDAESKIEVVHSSNGCSKTSSKLTSPSKSEIKVKGASKSVKKAKYMTNSSLSSENEIILKELQVKLVRCDTDTKLCNRSGIVSDDNSRQIDDVKSRSESKERTSQKLKKIKESSGKAWRGKVKKMNNIPEVVENKKDENGGMVNLSDEVNSKSFSEVKSISILKQKRSKNPRKMYKEINGEEADAIHTEAKLSNGDGTKECQEEKDESVQICYVLDVNRSKSLNKMKSKSRRKRKMLSPTESDKEVNDTFKETETVQPEINGNAKKECLINFEKRDEDVEINRVKSLRRLKMSKNVIEGDKKVNGTSKETKTEQPETEPLSTNATKKGQISSKKKDGDVEMCDTSDVVVNNLKSRYYVKSKSKTKKEIMKRGKNLKDTSEKAESAQPESKTFNDDATKEFHISLKRCHIVEENAEMSSEKPSLSADVDEKLRTVPNKTGKRKRESVKKAKGDGDDDDAKPSKSAKKEKDSDKAKSSKDKIPDVTGLDFSNNSKSSSGNEWNFKISSWNVNGIRAWLEKNGLSYLHHEEPDIICIQETKCSDDKLPEEVKAIEGYHAYWLSGDKDGYSGVGLLTKKEPINVEYGIGISEHDNEGRVITAEYEKFYLVGAYVPNAGRKLVRLDYRMKWDKDFRAFLKKLDAKKPVILCGDLNVAHEEIDLANPKTNKKNAGFTVEEREGFSSLLSEGFTDTFRYLYPHVKGAYTFWTYMMNARAKDVGWRLDYFVISERFKENLCDSVIRKDVMGSDHCPITLFIAV